MKGRSLLASATVLASIVGGSLAYQGNKPENSHNQVSACPDKAHTQKANSVDYIKKNSRWTAGIGIGLSVYIDNQGNLIYRGLSSEESIEYTLVSGFDLIERTTEFEEEGLLDFVFKSKEGNFVFYNPDIGTFLADSNGKIYAGDHFFLYKNSGVVCTGSARDLQETKGPEEVMNRIDKHPLEERFKKIGNAYYLKKKGQDI